MRFWGSERVVPFVLSRARSTVTWTLVGLHAKVAARLGLTTRP